ncbi:MAG: DUF3141 domain-containing protein [Alphaproteobacteria bacterium]|nr:DUF3141 domain-containing protein [Alphaproteobacteria bacterium]
MPPETAESDQPEQRAAPPSFQASTYPFRFFQQAMDYWIDACQRGILFADVLRQRSNAHLEHEKSESPTVLHFKHELLLDGRKLAQPVNYQLVRILPPEGVETDPAKRPFVVFDPRAGHGPGIGGMKPDSEIGSTLRAGHPCYFVGFLPEPVPGQTVEHVCETEAIFVAKVMELHPDAGKPCLIGNCQAGWQISMMSALYPELVGVLILAGAPMSYWAGVRGKNPMRYKGGLLGGSWLAAFSSDIGHGNFDGASLVQNFENMNPGNTYWKKAHNLYARIDTEAPRFLEFERWWGSPILLNGEEIQFIVDDLFVGNRLSTARLATSEGLRIDIRNIKAPIIVFCSMSDDITPPQQALGWILDMYRNEEEILAAGQTIIYCMHQSAGHLGIFVSSSVASKEHDKFIHNIDLIETLPPGLYEAVFLEKEEGMPCTDLASGEHVLRFENRTLDDIRAYGCNSPNDDARFATVSRISDNWRGMYETFLSPYVRTFANEKAAEALRAAHPIRMRYTAYSDRNPAMKQVGQMAEIVRNNRRPVGTDNIFWNWQEAVSKHIVMVWNAYRDMRDMLVEKTFLEVYGSPLLQASVGLRNSRPYTKSYANRDVDRERGIRQRLHGLAQLGRVGGLREAMIRALLYVVRASKGIDERAFRTLQKLCAENPDLSMTAAELRAQVRAQAAILAVDEKEAMETLSVLLDSATMEGEVAALDVVRKVVEARGEITSEARRRLSQLEKYFTAAHTSFQSRSHDVQIFREENTGE